MVDLYRLLIVGAVASILLTLNLSLFARWILKTPNGMRHADATPASLLFRWLKRGVIALGAACMLAVPWGVAEPYFPKIETVEIPTDKLYHPVRIVQLSDLHCDPVVRAETRVIEAVNSLKPDLIVFTGDGVNSDAGIPVFRRTMRTLSKVAPIFGVQGNWEAWWFTHVDTFAGTGIHELDGDAVAVTLNRERLWLGGTAVDNERTFKRVLRKMPKDAFRIILHHYPAAWRRVDGRADLLLSGDTHGGQLTLPFLGPLVRISRWDKRFYPPGLHQSARGLRYYVNRGIGMEGRSVPRVRLNTPPEVTLITLRPKNNRR